MPAFAGMTALLVAKDQNRKRNCGQTLRPMWRIGRHRCWGGSGRSKARQLIASVDSRSTVNYPHVIAADTPFVFNVPSPLTQTHVAAYPTETHRTPALPVLERTSSLKPSGRELQKVSCLA